MKDLNSVLMPFDIGLFYSRRKTRIVHIGDVPLGGKYPVRVQSMTNTPTLDTKATVEQTIQLINAGCEYVRITAPGIAEANNLKIIKENIRKAGFNTPLVADIHFKPEAALIAAGIVEKVRINPGNYADKKSFNAREYSEADYSAELERIAERIHPLLKRCKEYGTAIRIGVNHGSLSDRIMSRYGDTIDGMVESAMEFARICNNFSFNELVISMKSSNIRTMIAATRLLAKSLDTEGLNFPIHLGVTEAGNGDDGRIKSALGIGSLLEDGIGDTIRISLTENPVNEILPARDIARRYKSKPAALHYGSVFLSSERTVSDKVQKIGGSQPPAVITSCTGVSGFNCYYFADSDYVPDYLFNSYNYRNVQHPEGFVEIEFCNDWLKNGKTTIPLFNAQEYVSVTDHASQINFVGLTEENCQPGLIRILSGDRSVVLVLQSNYPPSKIGSVHQFRRMIKVLIDEDCKRPVVIRREYGDLHYELVQLYSSIEFGSLLVDHLIDGIWLDGDHKSSCKFPVRVAFNILQCSRDRITRNDYIACPSCGRTQFNIQSVLNKVREKTSHIKGLKIAVMGCVVNGPGEMADADYGYVGAGPGKVNLYKGKALVKRQIPEDNAIDELLSLIVPEK